MGKRKGRLVNPQTRIRYVPLDDRDLPEEEQCVFELRPLTAADVLATDGDPGKILRAAIVGWENVLDTEGGQVDYAPAKVSMLDVATMNELTQVVTSSSHVDLETGKP